MGDDLWVELFHQGETLPHVNITHIQRNSFHIKIITKAEKNHSIRLKKQSYRDILIRAKVQFL